MKYLSSMERILQPRHNYNYASQSLFAAQNNGLLHIILKQFEIDIIPTGELNKLLPIPIQTPQIG